MKTVLVTGGFGNIGIKIIDELCARGYRVRCADIENVSTKKVARRYKTKIETVWCDITDRERVFQAVRGVDAVIHTAAILPPFSESQPALAQQVNVEGTRNVVAAIEQINPSAHLVFSSSVSVHGNHLPDHAPGRTANDPYNPVDAYSEQKVACERMLDQSTIDWSILRISACVDEKSRMLSLANIRGSLETFFRVHSMCRIEYIHPADVATAMVNAVDNQEAKGKRLLLGGGKYCRSYWRELNSIRLEMLGLGKPPLACFGQAGFYTEWLDTEESQRILHYQHHDLDDYREELRVLLRWPRRVLALVPSSVKKKIWTWVPYVIEGQW